MRMPTARAIFIAGLVGAAALDWVMGGLQMTNFLNNAQLQHGNS